MINRTLKNQSAGTTVFSLSLMIGLTFLLGQVSMSADVNAVQSGTLTINSNGGTNTITVNIANIDTSKSFLIFQSRHNNDRPVGSTVRGQIASPTTIQFVRVSNEAAPGTPINVQWYVVEYASGVRVQRGVLSQPTSSTTFNTTIAAVASTTRAFVIWSKTPRSNDTIFNGDDPVIGELTSTTNLQFRYGQAIADAHMISWQVIEFLDSTDILVQKGSLTNMDATTTSVSATLPTPVDLSSAFVLAGYRITGNSNSNIGARMLRAQLTNSATVVIDRAVTGNEAIPEIHYQVVELKDGSRVQPGNAAFASGTASVNATFNSVNLSRSVVFASVQSEGGQNAGRTSYVANDIPGVASATFSLTSGTSLTATRNSTVGAADVAWFVVEFAVESALPVQLASFSAQVRNGSDVLLEWVTLSEVNNFGFFVQRNGGDGTFYDITGSFVPGHGTTTTPHQYSYIHQGVETGTFQYRLKQIDFDGSTHYSEPVTVDILTSVGNEETPTDFVLGQNYPNPFNPSTTIVYQIPEGRNVALIVYDMLGQRVRELVNQYNFAGTHSTVWDGTNDFGEKVVSGTYVYRLEAGQSVKTNKMILLK